MGQKVNPVGFRLGVNRGWDSVWYAKKKDFGNYLIEDFKIREYIKKNVINSGVSKVMIERTSNKCYVTIYTSRPGFVIGKKGSDIDKIKNNLSKLTSNEVNLNIKEVRTKWRKAHKGRIHGTATRASTINYGAYALKALQPERVTGKQIEAARVALTRHMKRQGRVWTRIFPNIPVSKKPIEVRMGKGKGSPEYFACRVKPGRILFEVDGVSEQIAKEALYKASAKLPIKTKTIKRFA